MDCLISILKICKYHLQWWDYLLKRIIT
jgi:hypothetical protein